MESLSSLFASPYYSNLHRGLIVTHVTLALIALALGPVAMLTHKGRKWHRRAGEVFFWSMVLSLVAAIALLFFRFNPFLAGITALSLNGVVTGVRSLQRKRPQAGAGPTWFDWLFAIIVLASGLGLIGFGIAAGMDLVDSFIPSSGNTFVLFVVLPMIFGFFAANDAWADIRSLRTPSQERNWWWYYHMERMCGSYIALFTALMVQQVGPRLPGEIAWMVWIAPTLIGAPLIGLWIRHYKTRFAQTRARTRTSASVGAHARPAGTITS